LCRLDSEHRGENILSLVRNIQQPALAENMTCSLADPGGHRQITPGRIAEAGTADILQTGAAGAPARLH